MGWESYLRTFAVSFKCTGSQRNTDKKNKERERGRNRFDDIRRIQEILQKKMWKGRGLEELSGRS